MQQHTTLKIIVTRINDQSNPRNQNKKHFCDKQINICNHNHIHLQQTDSAKNKKHQETNKRLAVLWQNWEGSSHLISSHLITAAYFVLLFFITLRMKKLSTKLKLDLKYLHQTFQYHVYILLMPSIHYHYLQLKFHLFPNK